MKELDPTPTVFRELDRAAERLLTAAAPLSDTAVTGPSRLPGWTRAHVLSHLAAQAPALERLLTWARTGVRNDQYADREARDAEIETGSLLPAAALVAGVRESAQSLQRAVETLPGPAWDATIMPFTGEICTPRRILVIRLRELVLHLVDLDVGHEVADIPATARDIVLADVIGYYAEAEKVPAFILTDAAGVELARFSGGGPVVSGARAELLAWLTGRGDGALLDAPGGLPALPPWI
ncbi:maleylpyruvate isomerase N-terminal domain-containing protein [Streptomyces galbus]|uniref:Maleylpyruvate isomerase family mycothiol-dependent enzyme n=1 Tax=Streptomyces galbus TaxID=33898 RepID=A0A4U5WXI4_STRGB|nr:maleylpyruvate isomerase N-terminal domain-containing protein [Streptomyces galbus]TKT06612.1 maleylpyruvate isomerase family mycothiol-dependent enzyme [Streptomyces galbus]GHD53711.1 maleylpyruvate isomerase [Streptomyces galbus]